MKLLEKIQNLPLKTRKIIFWLALIVLAAVLFWWRFGDLPQKFNNIEMPEININVPEI